MATLRQALKLAKKIETNKIESILFGIIKKLQKEIIKKNQEQLAGGKDVYNKTIGLYSKATELITTHDYLTGKRKNIKKEGTPFTAQDTGDFFKGFYLEVQGDVFKIFSKDPKTHEILDSWGTDAIFGLSDKDLRELVNRDVLPFLLKNIKNILEL